MNKKINFNGVFVNENPDERDYHISRFVPNVDEVVDESFMLKLPELEIIKNQTKYNACVGYSYALAKSILEYQHTNKWIEFDPFMIYGTRLDGEYDGEGMYSWQGARNLYKEGAYLQRDFNIKEEMPELKRVVDNWKLVNPKKVEEAKQYTITGYSRVEGIKDIKRALKKGMPISAAFPIYSSLYDVKEDGILHYDKTDENVEGYHQMTIVGWTINDQWVVVNSWGQEYGMKGIYYIPFDYPIEDAMAISDTIFPSKYKAKDISFKVGSHYYAIDNSIKYFDVVSFLENGRVYVPIRLICEALGCSVEWNAESQIAIINSEEAIIEIPINSHIIIVNNKKIVNDAPAKLIEDRTMLPIRIIAENLNCNVNWKNHSVIINSK